MNTNRQIYRIDVTFGGTGEDSDARNVLYLDLNVSWVKYLSGCVLNDLLILPCTFKCKSLHTEKVKGKLGAIIVFAERRKLAVI